MKFKFNLKKHQAYQHCEDVIAKVRAIPPEKLAALLDLHRANLLVKPQQKRLQRV